MKSKKPAYCPSPTCGGVLKFEPASHSWHCCVCSFVMTHGDVIIAGAEGASLEHAAQIVARKRVAYVAERLSGRSKDDAADKAYGHPKLSFAAANWLDELYGGTSDYDDD